MVTRSVSVADPFHEKSTETYIFQEFGQYKRVFPHMSENRLLKREEGTARPSGLIPDEVLMRDRGIVFVSLCCNSPVVVSL